MSGSQDLLQQVMSMAGQTIWIWIWFVPAAIGAFFSGFRDFVLDLAGIIFGNHRSVVNTAPEQRAVAAQPLAPKTCLHSHAVQVRTDIDGVDSERVAWWCPDCEQQLDANWAILPEDLPGA